MLKKISCAGVLSIGLASALYYSPAYAESSEVDELRERIDELESIVIDLEDKTGGGSLIKSFNSLNIDFGGYYHGVARQFDFTNSADQDGGNVQGFDRNLLYLRVEADITDKWSVSFGNLFGQADIEQPEVASLSVDTDRDGTPDYLDNFAVTLNQVPSPIPNTGSIPVPAAALPTPPANSPGHNQLLRTSLDELQTVSLNFPVDVNLKYKHSDALEFTLGRQRAQVGYHSRQLYPQSWRLTELPRFLLGRNGVSNIFNPFIQGLNVGGKFYPGSGEHILSYNASVADTFNPTGLASFDTHNNEQSALRVAYGRADQSFEIGLNFIAGRREQPGGSQGFYGGNRFTAYGTDIFYNDNILQFIVEYYSTDEGTDVQGTAVPDKESYIIQPSFHLTRWLDLYLTHDVIDAPLYEVNNPAIAGLAAAGINTLAITQRTVFAPSHFGEVVENTIGFYIKPADQIRLRVGYTRREYKDLGEAEVNIPFVSATASF